MAYIVPCDIPEKCIDCPFHTPYEYFLVSPEEGLYQKISRCFFAPEEIEDPYRDAYWQCDNKEIWCPLKEVEGEG